MDGDRSFERLRNRWTFDGQLRLESALHVGGGDTAGLASDSPIARDAYGRPLLPATTLKGALRATVDRLAPVAGSGRGLHTCGLSPLEERCPSPPGSPARAAVERALREFAGSEREREEQLLHLLEERLCATCRLFGSTWLAGRLFVADAYPADEGDLALEIRDGVGIDRDSGTLREHTRYSYEALPATAAFALHVEGENLAEEDLALLALAFGELRRGAVRIGGGGGHGLGACRLELQRVQSVRLTADAGSELRAYLLDGSMQAHDPADWLRQSLDWLFAAAEEGQ